MLGIKWNLVRNKRVELEKKHQQVLDNITITNFWLHMALKHLMVKRFHDICRQRILSKIRMLKMCFLFTLFNLKYKRITSHLKPTVLLRNKQQLRQSLNVIACVKLKGLNHQAAFLLCEFLTLTDLIWKVVGRVKKTYSGIVFIQQSFKKHYASMHSR